VIVQVEDDGYSTEQSTAQRMWEAFKARAGWQKPGTLILIRHGESKLNYSKTFTGWIDTDLSERGYREIEHAARLLLEQGYEIDVTYTSRLKRAIRSSWVLMRELNQIYLPMYKSWRLNERMYGALEGLSKPGLAQELGEHVVQNWRAGLTARPPPITPDHPHWHHNEKK
jgi:2,3-bisphosphoglycerate-dependent phosphoglycerate mutase